MPGGPAAHRTRRGAMGLVVAGLVAAVALLPAPAPATTAAASTASTSCAPTGVRSTLDVPYRRVPGVDPSLLSLDHHVPVRPDACGAAPMVVYVHGGGFVTGDKGNRIARKVDLFTGEGWVFASVNHRLSPSPPNDQPGQVRHPTHVEDVAAAVAWLRGNAAALGGDPDRIFLMGHSAGAFLTSLVSTDTSFLTAAGVTSGAVRCTVALDTEYDIPARIAQGGSGEAVYRNAFGNDPAVWAQASPITHTGAGVLRPRFLVVTQGVPRRVAGAEAFGSALRAGGTAATVVDASPLDHEGVNQAVGAPGDTRVTPPLMSFLRGCARAPTAASDASWATAAHHDLLGRAPTEAERRGAVIRLGAGTGRATIAAGLAASEEWVSRLVRGFYADTLGRDPDPGGLAFWVEEITTGRRTVVRVAAGFYASPEYHGGIGGGTDRTWITDLYRKLLHREPDAAGLAHWQAQSAARGRPHVAAAILGSLEARRDRVDALYRDLLDRPADPSGLAHWAGRLASEDDLALAVHLVASAEYGRRAELRHP